MKAHHDPASLLRPKWRTGMPSTMGYSSRHLWQTTVPLTQSPSFSSTTSPKTIVPEQFGQLPTSRNHLFSGISESDRCRDITWEPTQRDQLSSPRESFRRGRTKRSPSVNPVPMIGRFRKCCIRRLPVGSITGGENTVPHVAEIAPVHSIRGSLNGFSQPLTNVSFYAEADDVDITD